MTRTFDLSSATDQYFPVDALRELQALGQQADVRWVVIGAVARDLVIHFPLNHEPQRITHDVDIAVAVDAGDGYRKFTRGMATRHGGDHSFQIAGTPVDVLPTTPTGADGTVEFSDGNRLDVTGLAEAAASPDRVILAEDLVVEVASIEAQCALKVLAWRDRHADNPKDAVDLISLLNAGSEGIYEEETWNDHESLAATDHDIILAGAYRLGRIGRTLFAEEEAASISAILNDPRTQDLIPRHARSPLAAELLEAYTRGFTANTPMQPITPTSHSS